VSEFWNGDALPCEKAKSKRIQKTTGTLKNRSVQVTDLGNKLVT
jgi:hypothetical protein